MLDVLAVISLNNDRGLAIDHYQLDRRHIQPAQISQFHAERLIGDKTGKGWEPPAPAHHLRLGLEDVRRRSGASRQPDAAIGDN